jgi:hypothetical protein
VNETENKEELEKKVLTSCLKKNTKIKKNRVSFANELEQTCSFKKTDKPSKISVFSPTRREIEVFESQETINFDNFNFSNLNNYSANNHTIEINNSNNTIEISMLNREINQMERIEIKEKEIEFEILNEIQKEDLLKEEKIEKKLKVEQKESKQKEEKMEEEEVENIQKSIVEEIHEEKKDLHNEQFIIEKVEMPTLMIDSSPIQSPIGEDKYMKNMNLTSCFTATSPNPNKKSPYKKIKTKDEFEFNDSLNRSISRNIFYELNEVKEDEENNKKEKKKKIKFVKRKKIEEMLEGEKETEKNENKTQVRSRKNKNENVDKKLVNEVIVLEKNENKTQVRTRKNRIN